MKKMLLFLFLVFGTLAVAENRPVLHHEVGVSDNPTITVPEPAEVAFIIMAMFGLAGAVVRKFKR